jgi:hypothetical protein
MPPARRRGRPARGTDGALSEAAWQGQVEALARFYGWLVYHPPDNRPVDGRGRRQRTTRGFPDLTLVRGAELIFAELKRDTTYPDADQRAWLDALRQVADAVDWAAGVDGPAINVYVWRPRDFDDVQARLARGRQIVPASFAPLRPA